MQSHDAEFSDHGRTPIPQGANHYLEGASMPKEKIPAPDLPVNENCNKCSEPIKVTDSWGRDKSKLRVHFPRCVPATFTSEQLDAEVDRLIADGNDMMISLNNKVAQAEAAFHLALSELHDLARMSLTEKHEIKANPSADADVNDPMHDVETDPETGKLLH